MKITIELYGQARALFGAAETTLDLPDRATVEDALHRLSRGNDRLAALLNLADHPHAALLSVGETRVESPRHPLRDGDRLTVIPPIAGGSPPGPPERTDADCGTPPGCD